MTMSFRSFLIIWSHVVFGLPFVFFVRICISLSSSLYTLSVVLVFDLVTYIDVQNILVSLFWCRLTMVVLLWFTRVSHYLLFFQCFCYVPKSHYYIERCSQWKSEALPWFWLTVCYFSEFLKLAVSVVCRLCPSLNVFLRIQKGA